MLPTDGTTNIAVKPVTRSGNYTAWFEVQCPQSNFAWIPINLDPNNANPFDKYNFNEDIPNPTVREAAKSNPVYLQPRNKNKRPPLTGANNIPINNIRTTSSAPLNTEQNSSKSEAYHSIKNTIKKSLAAGTKPSSETGEQIIKSTLLDHNERGELILFFHESGGQHMGTQIQPPLQGAHNALQPITPSAF